LTGYCGAVVLPAVEEDDEVGRIEVPMVVKRDGDAVVVAGKALAADVLE